MKIVVLVISVFIVLTGCVRFEVKPGNIVSDTVDAGKDLYHTLKRKRSGEEQREYTIVVESENEQVDPDNFKKCHAMLLNNIDLSSAKLSKILSESSEVVIADDGRKIRCSVIALVFPNKI